MSTVVRMVVTTGIAWILSLTVAIAVILGIHRALSAEGRVREARSATHDQRAVPAAFDTRSARTVRVRIHT